MYENDVSGQAADGRRRTADGGRQTVVGRAAAQQAARLLLHKYANNNSECQ